jgi:hypothetical protein
MPEAPLSKHRISASLGSGSGTNVCSTISNATDLGIPITLAIVYIHEVGPEHTFQAWIFYPRIHLVSSWRHWSYPDVLARPLFYEMFFDSLLRRKDYWRLKKHSMYCCYKWWSFKKSPKGIMLIYAKFATAKTPKKRSRAGKTARTPPTILKCHADS